MRVDGSSSEIVSPAPDVARLDFLAFYREKVFLALGVRHN